MSCTAEQYLNVFRSWLGYSELNGKHRKIIDIYNNDSPLPKGYKVKYSDEWCDTTVSAAAIKAGAKDIIGKECGCDRHIAIFKKLGIWIEDGTITPKPGDIILFHWNSSRQPNDGFANHIGVVEHVANGYITTIEGNRMSQVARRVIPVGWGYIRGYARPKYDKEKPVKKKSITTIAKEVIAGEWGNGSERKSKIEAAGYDYKKVQAKVNTLLRG